VKYYQRKWFAVLLLIFFAPVGVFLIYKYGHFKRKTNLILSIIFGLFFLSVVINGGNTAEVSNEVPKEKATPATANVEKTEEEIKAEKLAVAEAKAKKEEEAKLKAEAEKKKKEEESAVKKEQIKISYTKEIKPRVNQYNQAYDENWEKIWKPTMDAIGKGSNDYLTAYNNMQALKDNYEGGRIISLDPAKGMSKEDKKLLKTYSEKMGEAFTFRVMAVDIAQDAFNIGDITPEQANKMQTYVQMADSSMIEAAAAITTLEFNLGIEK
jgi:hypothetical protein